jgi:hypothetical protein
MPIINTIFGGLLENFNFKTLLNNIQFRLTNQEKYLDV